MEEAAFQAEGSAGENKERAQCVWGTTSRLMLPEGKIQWEKGLEH